jgi:RHS repeat-associated protein
VGLSGLPSSFTPTQNSNFNSNNQLGIQSSAYDSAGNLKAIGGYSFAYDAENRQVSAAVGSTTANYSYDGEGRRVQKVSSGVTTVYVYDAAGEVAAEYSTGPPAPTGTQYLTADHLGSTRLVSNASGAVAGYHDYLPFGEEIPSPVGGRGSLYWAAEGVTHKFTGKERDTETSSSAMLGLDYFGARYFSSTMGRFASPDAPLVDQDSEDGQSWSLYGYVRNNPLKFIDPTGRDCIYTSTFSQSARTVQVEAGSCSQAGGTYVAGTIDAITYDPNGNSLDYGYNAYEGGTASVGSTSLSGPDPGLMALRESGNRAAGTISAFAIAAGAFATAYVSTYAAPAVIALLTTAGETGAVGPGVGLLKLAQRYGLNLNSEKSRQILDNLDMSVEEFVGKYRWGSIKRAPGWTFDGMTVREALDAGARKLLTDGRFSK